MASTKPSISETCEQLYKKLNIFVTKVIDRDVQPQIDSLNNSPTNTSKEILENDDLNDYTEVGMYYCPYNTVATTLSNCPVTNGFALFVEKFSGYDNNCTQTLTTYNGTRLLKFIRTFQTVDGVFQHSGWQPLYDDTGWVTLSWSNNFVTHSNGQNLKVRRVGKIVQLTGWAKPKSSMTIDADNPKTVCTLPEQFRPNATLEVLCQGSQMAIFLLTVTSNGDVAISRYRFTNSTSTTYPSVPNTAWLPFNVTWIVP